MHPVQWNPAKLGKVGVVAKIFLENTLGEWRINILKEKEGIQRRLERGKMTTATQLGIEPETSRFLDVCSTN